MKVVLGLARADLRRRLLATVLLAIVVGFPAGAVFAAATGARRNATAYDRLLSEGNASDLLVNPNNGDQSALDPAKVAALPQVEAMGRVDGLLAVVYEHGKPDFSALKSMAVFATDAVELRQIDRPKILDGRLPALDSDDEIALDERLADRRRLHVGSMLQLEVFTPEQLQSARGALPKGGQVVSMRVVGLVLNDTSLVSNEATETLDMFVGPALLRHTPSLYYGLSLALRNGAADVPAVEREIDALAPGESIVYQTLTASQASAQRVIRPQTVAIAAFGFVAGVAVLLAAAQALARHLGAARHEMATLRALGCTRRMLCGLVGLRALVIAVAAVAVGVGVAIVLSYFTPVGTARLAEPHPGIEVNLAFLAVGAVATAVLLLIAVALPVWRMTGDEHAARAAERQTATSRLIERLWSRPTVAIGARNALVTGRAERALPVRSALVGSIVAVAWVVSAAVFAASLSHFVDNPDQWGWKWDALVTISTDSSPGAPTGSSPVAPTVAVADALAAQHDTVAVAMGAETEVNLNGQKVTTVALTARKGPVPATLDSGRAPRTVNEVALGSQTIGRLGAHVGGTVAGIDRTGKPVTLHVVGQAVFPGLAAYPGEDPTSLGSGALITYAGYERLGAHLGSEIVVIGLGPKGSATTVRHAVEPWYHGGQAGAIDTIVTRPQRPSDVSGLIEVRSTPYLLAVLLGLLALATVSHALLTSVRRRRRDLAVLKAIGFRRGQLAAAVSWQATILTVVALAVGVPLGVAAGRVAWKLAAGQLGVPAQVRIPGLALVAIAAGVMMAANALAAIPARSAARVPVAEILHTE